MNRESLPPTPPSITHRLFRWKHQMRPCLQVRRLAPLALPVRDLLAGVVDNALVLRDADLGEHAPPVEFRTASLNHYRADPAMFLWSRERNARGAVPSLYLKRGVHEDAGTPARCVHRRPLAGCRRRTGAVPPPFSPAVVAGNFVFLSGMLPTDAAGQVVAGDVRVQTARALDNLSALLERNGSRMAQVAAVTVYLKNQADFAAMNEVYSKYWPKDPPTRTTVMVNLVAPDALVEVSMVALRDGVERRVVHPASWLRSPNPYSYGIQSGDTLFLSGLVSRNGKDNTAVPGDMKTQTETVLKNAGEILAAANMTMADVVSSRVFITDTGDVPGHERGLSHRVHRQPAGPRHRQGGPHRPAVPRRNHHARGEGRRSGKSSRRPTPTARLASPTRS